MSHHRRRGPVAPPRKVPGFLPALFAVMTALLGMLILLYTASQGML